MNSGLIFVTKDFWWPYFHGGGGGGGLGVLLLEGVLHFKDGSACIGKGVRENAAPERIWVADRGIERPCKYYLHAPKKYKHGTRLKQFFVFHHYDKTSLLARATFRNKGAELNGR